MKISDNSNENIQNSEEKEDESTLYILNEVNKWITVDYITKMLKNYGVNIEIKNLDNFKLATIHRSYLIRDEEQIKNNKTKNTNKDLEPIKNPELAIPLQIQSYERLEFLGDSVIHLILAEYLYKRYENEDEGFMTRLRTKIESGDTLSELTKIIGLDQYILISRYIEHNGGRQDNKNILEDAFEAFMAALFMEVGFEPCRKFLIQLVEQEIDFARLLHTETNYKDMLLQFFHKMNWEDPSYGVLDISGPEHKKMFTMYVKRKKTPRDVGEVIGTGIGSSKKRGEQEAAREALVSFGIINQDDDSDSEDMEELDESFNESFSESIESLDISDKILVK